ncbi:MAG: M23 family metallopeptidase [bacterium]|nr:M23 family metallopeptidase [bacterium]
MQKLMVLMTALLLMAEAWAGELVDIFNYPVSPISCDTKTGPFLGFEKKTTYHDAGYRLGEHWSHKDLTSTISEPVFTIAKGTVIDVAESGESDLGTVVVIEHWMLDNSLAYSVYGNLSPTVVVDEEVTGGEQIGQVAGDYLYFSIQTRPWHLDDKRYEKKVTLESIGAYYAPSNFIDQRLSEYVKPLIRGWNSIKVPVDASWWLASCKWNGQTANLRDAIDNNWIDQVGKLIDPAGNSWDIYLDSFVLGFANNLGYEIKALKEGVTLHIYQPAYQHLDQMAMLDMIKVAWLYHETQDHQIIVDIAKPKNFKPANSIAEPGFKAYQMKFKTGQLVRDDWGKQVTFYLEYNTVHPWDRYVKFADSTGTDIISWTLWGQNPVDK